MIDLRGVRCWRLRATAPRLARRECHLRGDDAAAPHGLHHLHPQVVLRRPPEPLHRRDVPRGDLDLVPRLSAALRPGHRQRPGRAAPYQGFGPPPPPSLSDGGSARASVTRVLLMGGGGGGGCPESGLKCPPPPPPKKKTEKTFPDGQGGSNDQRLVVEGGGSEIPGFYLFQNLNFPLRTFSIDPVGGGLGGWGVKKGRNPGTPTTGPRERGNDTTKGAPAAAADRTQRPDATCEGTNGALSRAP